MCAENFVIYRAADHPEVRAVIPRRTSLPADRGVLLTCAASHKQKNMFFVLVQVGVCFVLLCLLAGGGFPVCAL